MHAEEVAGGKMREATFFGSTQQRLSVVTGTLAILGL